MTFRVNEPQIIHQTVDEEAVIVDLGSGSYYSLRGSAQVIWSALARGLDPSGVLGEVAARYEGDATAMAAAVDAFVTQLVDDRLIVGADASPHAPIAEEVTADGGPPGPPTGTETTTFESPAIERFDDLQDLILLDPVHEVSEEEGWPHARSTDGG